MPTIGMRMTSWKMRQLTKRKPETAIFVGGGGGVELVEGVV